MLAELTNNPDWGFIFSAVGMVCGIIALAQSKLSNILAWGVVAVGLAGVLVWWP